MSSPEVICIVQARMGSSRLPGKVLRELGDQPMLGLLLDRLARLDPTVVGNVIVATSDLVGDDPIAAFCQVRGTPVVRGSERDVLGRYVQVLAAYPADHVVRITGDCPLTDPAIVQDVVALHLERGADYTCNVLPRTFPKGLDVEVASAEALRTAAAEAVDDEEREHVTPFLYRRPGRFVLANLRSGDDLGDLRWTVDTPQDLAALAQLVEGLDDPVRAAWREVLDANGEVASLRRGLRLRPATAADATDLLAWRNDPTSVAFSASGTAVEESEHRAWLARRLDDPGCRLLVADCDGREVAMLRIDVADAVGTVSIAVAPQERGRGLGSAILVRAVEELAGDMQVRLLVAEVLAGNAASLAAFGAAGFVVEAGDDRLVRLVHTLRSSRPSDDPQV